MTDHATAQSEREPRPIAGTCIDIDGDYWHGHGPGSKCPHCDPSPANPKERNVPSDPDGLSVEQALAARIRGALNGETAYEGSTHRLALSMPQWNTVIHALEDRLSPHPTAEAGEGLLRAASRAAEFIRDEYAADNDEGVLIPDAKARRVFEALIDAGATP